MPTPSLSSTDPVEVLAALRALVAQSDAPPKIVAPRYAVVQPEFRDPPKPRARENPEMRKARKRLNLLAEIRAWRPEPTPTFIEEIKPMRHAPFEFGPRPRLDLAPPAWPEPKPLLSDEARQTNDRNRHQLEVDAGAARAAAAARAAYLENVS